jgi:predicted RNA binding protein YcfA (HicA-like mRNA interferase family)/predicted RNase H-like HicB family nuclease
MPPQSIKVREVIRLLERDGWRHVRTTGSRRQYQHSIKSGTVTVSGNLGTDMPVGTLRSILKRARVSRRTSVEYLVVVEKGPSSYGAYVPDLPGCVAAAETRREVRKLIREGIQLHIRALREAGEPVLAPASKSETVRIRAA